MNIFFTLTSILFFLWAFRNILFWVYLWQLKEYRTDRLLVHIRETIQGKRLLFSPLLFLTLLGIIGYALVISESSHLPYYQIFVFFIFALKAIEVAREFFQHKVKRPTLTFKASLILTIAILLTLLFYYVPLLEKFLWLLFLDKAVVFLVTVLVLLLSIPTEFYRDLKIEKAMKKIQLFRTSHKKLLVIGVTGSYGKSSTKEFIAQILGKKFNVLKTIGSQNTPIGVAHTIINGLKSNTEIFVAEMGAYKKGEISEICQIVFPEIGVLTGVSEQHVSLFGSIKNIMDAKYELINSLPKTGLAIFNGNNKNARVLYNQTKRKKVLYQWKEGLTLLKDALSNDSQQNIYAYNLSLKKDSVAFDVILKSKTIHFKTYLIGSQNVENILPGIYIADHLGMEEAEIKKAVLDLTGLPKTMSYHKIPKGPVLIDDTFNANPLAIMAVLSYMKLYRGKRMLVLHPMIELGKRAEEEHYIVGRQVSRICDYIFLTNSNFNRSIKHGIEDEGGKCEMRISNVSEVAEFIIQHTKEEDIVVFEGKEANNVLQKIL